LQHFWFEFFLPQNRTDLVHLEHGCGVTANDYNDALQLLKQCIFEHLKMPPICHVTADLNISTLEVKRVRARMGDPTCRGVWFPLTSQPCEWA
jgi:hypothetical protein